MAALRQLQAEKPSYRGGAERWWSDVISRTAIGAGAGTRIVEEHLDSIVPTLMRRFGSREGYRLFDDTLEARESTVTCRCSRADMRQFVHFVLWACGRVSSLIRMQGLVRRRVMWCDCVFIYHLRSGRPRGPRSIGVSLPRTHKRNGTRGEAVDIHLSGCLCTRTCQPSGDLTCWR